MIQKEYVPTKGMKGLIIVGIVHMPMILLAQHMALSACLLSQQTVNAVTAGSAVFVLGFTAYQVKRRRSIFGRVVADWLDELRAAGCSGQRHPDLPC